MKAARWAMQGTSSHPLANSTTTSCSTAQGKTAISATPHLFSSPWTEALIDSPSFSSFLGLETSVQLWCKLAQCYWCQPAPALESAFTWQLLSFCKRNCSHRSLIFRLNMKKRWEVVWRERKESHETSKLFKGLPEFPPCISHPKHQRWWSSLPLGRVTTPLLFQ